MVDSIQKDTLTPEESQAQEFYSGLVLNTKNIKEYLGVAQVKVD